MYVGNEDMLKAIEELAEKYKDVKVEAVLVKIDGQWVWVPVGQDNERVALIGEYTGNGKDMSNFISRPTIGFDVVTFRKKD